jgi:hypothetical protein
MRINITFILLIILTSCSSYCDDYLTDKEVSGEIKSKFRDRSSHNLKKLVIANQNGEYILVIDDKDDKFWNFIEEGYHLSKKKESTLIVVRKNKIEYTFDICSD